ncbi:MAG: right-handed parallel beta-helix repeat-containing protein, partial [Promicromonosporaceae bacterium]|nr:right-handed parallel beta-helix repeat-containing protein [Promicromonosporaceae bacterium]
GNTITDCGQTGIVGHLGCAFSTIEDNHIYRIGIRREFYGHEIAGIKLHAPIDVVLRRNRIHECTLGVWLDWQTQGTQVTRNLLYANNRDLFIEVSHGPYVVDHNVLASAAALENMSQGGAYVNNLIAGTVRLLPVLDRTTPYHVPHSTQVAGFDITSGGDDRWLGNLFIGGNPDEAYLAGTNPHRQAHYGLSGYAEYPASFAEFQARKDPAKGDNEAFFGLKQPVYASGNVYVGGAQPFYAETDAMVIPEVGTVRVIEAGNVVHLEIGLPPAALAARIDVVTGANLPATLLVGAPFETPDGTPIRLDTDLLGNSNPPGANYPAGPLATLASARVRVW